MMFSGYVKGEGGVMFTGWGFARRKGGLPKPVLKWFNRFIKNNAIPTIHRFAVLRFGAACYRAGYRAGRRNTK